MFSFTLLPLWVYGILFYLVITEQKMSANYIYFTIVGVLYPFCCVALIVRSVPQILMDL